jgi:hypothetical protein
MKKSTTSHPSYIAKEILYAKTAIAKVLDRFLSSLYIASLVPQRRMCREEALGGLIKEDSRLKRLHLS